MFDGLLVSGSTNDAAVVLLIAIAYTLATEQGKQMRQQKLQRYVGRVNEPGRQQNGLTRLISGRNGPTE